MFNVLNFDRNTDLDWEKIGQTNPYYGVLSITPRESTRHGAIEQASRL